MRGTSFRRHWQSLLLIFIPLFMVANGYFATPAMTQELSTPEVIDQHSGKPCDDGRLRIRDLEQADRGLPDGLLAIADRAKKWQPDAQLVELRLACPLLTTGLVWEGTFFSENAQANFATDTASVEPSEAAPDEVPYLEVDGLSFQSVYRSLLRAGFSENLLLAPASSVTVRLSSESHPFGPPTAPLGVVYVHVAIEERGQVKDVWIDASNGTLYRYETDR